VSRTFVEVGRRRLSLSNLERDLYPPYGFTKAVILEYYRQMARFILPHLKDRALTLKRYPEGLEKDFFSRSGVPPTVRSGWKRPRFLRMTGRG
jgi:bifunctional non-homologous end joining protein LigD